jgi:hypothetical protein
MAVQVEPSLEKSLAKESPVRVRRNHCGSTGVLSVVGLFELPPAAVRFMV